MASHAAPLKKAWSGDKITVLEAPQEEVTEPLKRIRLQLEQGVFRAWETFRKAGCSLAISNSQCCRKAYLNGKTEVEISVQLNAKEFRPREELLTTSMKDSSSSATRGVHEECLTLECWR